MLEAIGHKPPKAVFSDSTARSRAGCTQLRPTWAWAPHLSSRMGTPPELPQPPTCTVLLLLLWDAFPSTTTHKGQMSH